MEHFDTPAVAGKAGQAMPPGIYPGGMTVSAGPAKRESGIEQLGHALDRLREAIGAVEDRTLSVSLPSSPRPSDGVEPLTPFDSAVVALNAQADRLYDLASRIVL